MKNLICIRLRIAGYIVGFLTLVASLLSTINSFYVVEEMYNYWDYISMNSIAISLSVFVYSVFALIASALLLLGIKKQNHRMLLPWLVIKAIGLIAFIVVCVENRKKLMSEVHIGYLVAGSISYAFILYLFIGIISLYNRIRLGRDD